MNKHRQQRDRKLILLTVTRLSAVFRANGWPGDEQLVSMATDISIGEYGADRWATRISDDVPFHSVRRYSDDS